MLTKLTVYDPSGRIPDPLELPLTPENRLDTDILQVTGIKGLEPVKATVGTQPYGTIDGSFFSGSNVADRNIVVDLLPKPDWVEWNIPKIRNEAYKYFMPRSYIRLVFESTERAPVEIFGYVETCEPNIFSKDNEIQISLICPDPHFKGVDVVVREGVINEDWIELLYDGTIESGILVSITEASGTVTTDFQIALDAETFFFEGLVSSLYSIVMSSRPGEKFLRNVDLSTGENISILNSMGTGSVWLAIQPGPNQIFQVLSDDGLQNWRIEYYERFGGL